MAEFFLTVAPGLEDLAQIELNAWLPGLEVTLEHGGLVAQAPLGLGLELNRCLKIPTRILLRLTDFGCRDFPKLFKKLQNIKWDEWLPDNEELEFEVSSHTSRLAIKRRILETCLDGRKSYLKKKGLKPSKDPLAKIAATTVFVRMLNDVCTVSLDTSGELLHKRGLRTHASEAPLRETIAAALLYSMLFSRDDGSIGALPKLTDLEIVDPMTGGGTFLLEAATLTKKLSLRRYAYEENLILNALATSAESEGKAVGALSCAFATPFRSLVGLDLSEKALASAKHNLAELVNEKSGTSVNVELSCQDIFKAKPLETDRVRWLIANPPYGERLRVEGGLSKFYERLFQAAEKWARPERACFLLPAKVRPQTIRAPQAWKLISQRPFANGGLPVLAAVFVRST